MQPRYKLTTFLIIADFIIAKLLSTFDLSMITEIFIAPFLFIPLWLLPFVVANDENIKKEYRSIAKFFVWFIPIAIFLIYLTILFDPSISEAIKQLGAGNLTT